MYIYNLCLVFTDLFPGFIIDREVCNGTKRVTSISSLTVYFGYSIGL